MLYYNTELKNFSRQLRKNMTEAEKLLWSKLRRRQLKGIQVYRQRIIGNYIADFYCPKTSLIIELDGGQHYSAEGMQRDAVHDEYLKSQGYTILRFSDSEVFENLEGVIERICGNL